MEEQHLSPLEATRESMREISGALIAIATVLAAVFIPMAFFGGSNGVVYRQFSITIVSAMALSVLVALIFTPALCVTLLRRTSTPAEHRRGFFGWFRSAEHTSELQSLMRISYAVFCLIKKKDIV